jgi:hypothetical protein
MNIRRKLESSCTDCQYDDNQLKKDEVYLGNVVISKIPPYFNSLKTLRFGKQAYDMYGDKLNKKFRPLFIHKSEKVEFDRLYNEHRKQIAQSL